MEKKLSIRIVRITIIAYHQLTLKQLNRTE